MQKKIQDLLTPMHYSPMKLHYGPVIMDIPIQTLYSDFHNMAVFIVHSVRGLQ